LQHAENDRLRLITALQQKALALETETAEAKKAYSLLEKSEAELRDFLENAVVPIHWVGADATIIWANRAELDLLGYSAEEYIGQDIRRFHADVPVIDDILKRLSCNQELQ